MAWNPSDATQLLTSGYDCRTLLWDVPEGEVRGELPLQPGAGTPRPLLLHPAVSKPGAYRDASDPVCCGFSAWCIRGASAHASCGFSFAAVGVLLIL